MRITWKTLFEGTSGRNRRNSESPTKENPGLPSHRQVGVGKSLVVLVVAALAVVAQEASAFKCSTLPGFSPTLNCVPSATAITLSGGLNLKQWRKCGCDWEVEHNDAMSKLNTACTDGNACTQGGSEFNVKAFGAVGDNVTDDTAAIQNALNACAAVRGKVYLAPGQYLTTSSLHVTDCTLEGSSPIGSGIRPSITVVGKPAIIADDTIHNGAIHQTKLKNFGVYCNVGPTTKGRHPTNIIDGIRLDASTDLEDVRVQYCDKGLITNARAGHNQVEMSEFLNNYYGIYAMRQPSNNDGGNFRCHNCQSAGNTFAAVGMAPDATLDNPHIVGGDFGFSPYGFWQEGVRRCVGVGNPFNCCSGFGTGCTSTGFMNDVMLDSVALEAIGNGAMFTDNLQGAAVAGQLTNVIIRNAGYSDASTDPTFNLPTSDCVGPADPYQCCIGSNTGCTHTSAITAGTCYNWSIKNGSHPFYTPNGGTSAVSCLQCQGKIEFSRDTSAAYIGQVACGTHPEFVGIQGGSGDRDWMGLTPVTSSVTCAATSKGWIYFDSTVGEPCFCNGSKWCKISSPTTCATSANCSGATTTTSTSVTSTSVITTTSTSVPTTTSTSTTSTSVTTTTSSTTSTTIFGTAYFIKNTGNDALDGLSDGNAWQTFAGKANTFAFQPGDALYLKSGDVWSEQLNPTGLSGGTSTHPILFSSYGAGARPIISTNLTANGAFRDAARSWLHLDNLDLRGGVNGYGVYAFRAVSGSVVGFSVTNSLLSGNHGLLIAASGAAFFDQTVISNNIVTPTATSLTHSGIEFTGQPNHPGRLYTNFTISNNIINPAGEDGIIVEDCDTGTISGNVAGGDGENSIDVKDSSHITISDNFMSTDTEYNLVVHEDEEEITPSGLSFSNLIEHNTMEFGGGNGVNGACIFIDYLHSSRITRNNISHCFTGAIAWNDHAVGTGNEFSSNVITNVNAGAGTDGAISLVDAVSPKIWNNTVYGSLNNANILQVLSGIHSTTVQLRNNIFYQTGTGRHITVASGSATTGWDSDYNIFFPDDGARFVWSGGAPTAFAGWQTSTSGDVHSTNTDPQFVSALSNLRLTVPTSPGIDTGANVGLTIDIDGSSIPVGIGPDKGAYEVASTGTTTTSTSSTTTTSTSSSSTSTSNTNPTTTSTSTTTTTSTSTTSTSSTSTTSTSTTTTSTTSTSSSTTTTTSTSSTTTTSIITGTAYFIKNSGDDTKDGKSDGNAWKTFAGKVNSFAFVAGDALYLNRGDTWSEQLRDNSMGNGTSGHPILFSAYGTGAKPIITTGLAGDGSFVNPARNYVTLDQLDIRTSVSNGYAVRSFGNNLTVTAFTVQNCNISGGDSVHIAPSGTGVHNLTNVSNNTITPQTTGGGNYGIDFVGVNNHAAALFTNFTISGNTISPAGSAGIYVKDCNTGTISNNTAGGNGNYSLDLIDCSHVTVNNNTFDNDTGYNIFVHEDDGETVPNNLAFDVTVNHNTLHRGGQGGSLTQCVGLKYLDDSHFTRNEIYDCFAGAFFENDNESSANANQFSGNIIHGTNVGTGGGGVIQFQDAVSPKVWNNTIYAPLNNAKMIEVDAGTHTTGVEIKNNIFVQTGSGLHISVATGGSTGFVSDFNDFFPDTGTRFFWLTGANVNFAAWKIASAGDTNSIVTDPLLVNPSTDMRPTLTTSPAINAATGVGLTTDRDSNTIPLGGIPDMGAYEVQ